MAKRLLSVQRIVNLSGDPASGNAGELYYNTGTNGYKFYNGSAWSELGGGGGVEVSSTIPAVGADGSLYFNSSNLTLNISFGGIWLEVGSVPPFDGGSALTSQFDGTMDGGGAATSTWDFTPDLGTSEDSLLLA